MLQVAGTVADYQAIIADDGYGYIVFGPDDDNVKAKAEASVKEFPAWGIFNGYAILYRNLVALP